MELKEFIGMNNSWEYNFEFESMMIRENFKSDENIFERFLTHKVIGKKPETETKNIVYPNAEIFIKKIKEDGYSGDDCDNCPLSQSIYLALWKDSFKARMTYVDKNKKEKTINRFEADTMNSAVVLLSKWVGTLSDSEKAAPKGYTKSDRYLLECFFGDNSTAFKDALKPIEDFVNSYHKLGNFVLVPKGFNFYRNEKFDDSWFLSLADLKNGFNLKKPPYYDKNKKERVYEDDKDCDDKVIVILDQEQYCSYINTFFLWDCVKIERASYVSKQVGLEESSDKRDILKLLEIYVNIIKRRGSFMFAMLVIQSESPDLYEKIKQFFNKERLIDGIDGAARKILDNEEIGSKIPEKSKEILGKLRNCNDVLGGNCDI